LFCEQIIRLGVIQIGLRLHRCKNFKFESALSLTALDVIPKRDLFRSCWHYSARGVHPLIRLYLSVLKIGLILFSRCLWVLNCWIL